MREKTMDRIHDLLAATFPGASVVVRDQVIGYRRRDDQFILLIETFGGEARDADGRPRPSQGGSFVVKIGPEGAMRKELQGWERCRPEGLTHDLVLLGLEEGKVLDVEGGPWMSIYYGDAQQFLGVEVTVAFERAALESVRSGFPRLGSVCTVIAELYERIGHLLYGQAFLDDPSRDGFAFDLPTLERGLACWESLDSSCRDARDEVNTLAEGGVGRFIDPVDYLRYVQEFVPWTGVEGSGRRGSELPPVAELPQPKPADLIPRLLRGCAHGDLHGRNILVGIVRDRAMWPVVFDYEDMGPGNLIGWDFVKLETELKIRAYPDLFEGGDSSSFIKGVQRFEVALAEQTERCHRERCWPEGAIADPAVDRARTTREEREDRLLALLLMIRRMASAQLGDAHGRPNEWLEELYFLLACYGVSTGRFPNLQRRERIGAFVSAGVSASRLTWPRLS